MNRNPVGIGVVWMAMGGVCGTASVAAQPAAAGPYGDLFNGSAKSAHQSLDLRGEVFGGYDGNRLSQAPTTSGTDVAFDPRLQAPGVTSGVLSTATYRYLHLARGQSGTQVQLGGVASVQEFTGAASKPLWVQNYDVNTAFGSALTPKVSVSATAVSSYGPYYQYMPFLTNMASNGGTYAPGINQMPASVSPVGTDIGYATPSDYVVGLNAGASITDRITKRSTISADVKWDDSRVPGVTSIETRSASARVTHSLTRKLALRAGFGLQDVRYEDGAALSNRALNQVFDVGVDYGDGMTIGRRFTFRFSTGTSVVREDNATRFRLDGSATLARTIGRTWSASIGATRGTYFILGFATPLFADVADIGIGGQLAPRLYFSAGAGYVRGENAFSSSDTSLASANASTRLTFGLNPHLGLYVQYSYYQYDVPDDFFSTLAFPQRLHRRSGSVGLTFWVPVLNQRTARHP